MWKVQYSTLALLRSRTEKFTNMSSSCLLFSPRQWPGAFCWSRCRGGCFFFFTGVFLLVRKEEEMLVWQLRLYALYFRLNLTFPKLVADVHLESFLAGEDTCRNESCKWDQWKYLCFFPVFSAAFVAPYFTSVVPTVLEPALHQSVVFYDLKNDFIICEEGRKGQEKVCLFSSWENLKFRNLRLSELLSEDFQWRIWYFCLFLLAFFLHDCSEV